MLQLDGAALEMSGKKFKYDVPKPFGPKGKAAFFEIVARPASSLNTDFQQKVDELMHQSRVADRKVEKAYEADKDDDAFLRGREENMKWVQKALAEMQYDACIMEWKSNIQNAGKDIEATRENYVMLAGFPHADIRELFLKIDADIQRAANFSIIAEEEVMEAEAKN